MLVDKKISSFLNKKTWFIPFLFGIMCSLFVTTVVLLLIRNFNNFHPRNAFSIGAELCAMIVAIMMTISILPSYKRPSNYNRSFVMLLTVGCFALFFDSLQLMYDGDTNYILLNKIATTLVFANSSLYLYFFWLYAGRVLNNNSKLNNVLDLIAAILMIFNFFAPFINLFVPVYFEINELGSFARSLPGWYFSQNFVVYLMIAMTTAIIISKEKLKARLIITAFVVIPIVAILVSGYANVPDGEPTVSLQYSSMMVSLVLIYAFLFSDNEKDLYSKNKELGLATNIQRNMLPSLFPAFPERTDFDVYASMTPAKEVGGDFYDFFLIDDSHLGLVIADVSDKGIPAALFMMACKIMVQNYAMLGQSPKEVINSVNKQICRNNQAGMFVTIWLGILDIKTGVLTACNAGHENPIIKKPDGHFEMFKDKHNFIVGWESLAPYSEYEIKLEKGTKLFVYTDGVPESFDGSVRFGNQRMVDALIKNENLDPKGILAGMSKALDEFVGKQDQFDDTTMLCLEYRGCQDE